MILKQMWTEFVRNRTKLDPMTCFYAGAAASLRKIYDLPVDTPVEFGVKVYRLMEEEAQEHMIDLDLDAIPEVVMCKSCKKQPAHTYGLCADCYNEVAQADDGRLDHQRKGEEEV